MTKLTDFGVAKAVGRLRSTRDGSIRGKIAYMSPEQVADSGIDQRADIYSFGVVLWELIAGRPMFEAETDVALFGKAMRGPTERVAEVMPDIPPSIDNAIWRALARDPRRRYPTARAFADALVAAFGAVDHQWVAAWMQERASALLLERQATVHALESIDSRDEDTVTITAPMSSYPRSSRPPSSHPRSLSSRSADETSAPMMIAVGGATEIDAPPPSMPEPRKRHPVPIAMLALVAAAVVVSVVLLVVTSKGPQAASPSPAPMAEPEPAIPTAAPPAVSVAAPGTALEPEPAPAPAPAPAPSVKTVSAKPRPATPKKAEKDPKADCNPPYTEDETGKHFKAWCLRP